MPGCGLHTSLVNVFLSVRPGKIYRVSQMAENRHLERNESWLADESIKDITFLVPGSISTLVS